MAMSVRVKDAVSPAKIRTSVPRRVFLVCNATFLILFALVCLVPFQQSSLPPRFRVQEAVVAATSDSFPSTSPATLINISCRTRISFALSVGAFCCVVLGTTISLVVITLAAYPLSKSNAQFRGRGFYTVFFTITMFFSGGLIPTYMVITGLGLYNKIWAARVAYGDECLEYGAAHQFFSAGSPSDGGGGNVGGRREFADSRKHLSSRIPSGARHGNPVYRRAALEQLV